LFLPTDGPVAGMGPALVNCGRGGLMDLDAALNALDSG
jgi:lactate dehydrogenase-like 2-hydroxyacid dehydrogenase